MSVVIYDDSGVITPLFFLEIVKLYPHYIYQIE
ncbi:MAG: hypothetical protein BMS9Abin25_1066 [Gammaproteobacteria bacterium]|nr:MAG: hypothetical protein BMS9Abin25_1066 [Gammaproteobacteria bacterium]